MTVSPFQYDVFISYAREDGPWVRRELFEPLERCRTAEGNRLRIFLDDSAEGVRPGRNFIEELTEGLIGSRRIILAFSRTYYTKPMCRWELNEAFRLSPTGADGRLVPIVIEPEAESGVPSHVQQIQYIRAWQADWFPALCRSLDVTPPRPPLTLQFQEPPPDVIVNHTLPPIGVVVGTGTALFDDEEVTLEAGGAPLQGTLTQKCQGGIATFSDLLFGQVVPSTRLFAIGSGGAAATSEPFAVLPAPEPVLPPPTPPPPDMGAAPDDLGAEPADLGEQPATIPGPGEPIFFGDSERLGVLMDEHLIVYDVSGHEAERVALRAPSRLLRVGPRMIGLADWAGNVVLMPDDGPAETWSLASESGGFVVPGGLWLDPLAPDRAAYVGLWDGRVFRLVIGEPAQEVLRHAGGIQALARLGERFYLYDLTGHLCVYEADQCVQRHEVEPVARMMKSFSDDVVAAGERHLYQLSPSSDDLFQQSLRLETIVSAYDETDLPVLIDRQGKGIQVDHELTIPVLFHTVAGAVPLSADRRGTYCVFKNPDGSRCLMERGRIVYSQPGGSLAVAPDGDRVALGDGREIRLLAVSSLIELAAGVSS